MVKLSDLKKTSVNRVKNLNLEEAKSLHRIEGQSPIIEPTENLRKINDRGVLGNVKEFFTEGVVKPIAIGIESTPALFESLIQVGLKNKRDWLKDKLIKDGAVFGISDEEFRNRTPEQRKRIRENNILIENLDRNIVVSENLRQKWIESTQTGIEAHSEEFLSKSPIPFTENFSLTRMIALGVESTPMLALAAITTKLTNSPTAGAAILGALESAEEFNIATAKGMSVKEANRVFMADWVVLTALETIPLNTFLKGGGITSQMFKVGVQEGGEEVLQNLWKDAVAKIGYDETRDLTEGLVENFIAGFISGATIGAFSPRRNIEVRKSKAVEKGVDVDKMTEVVAEQVIDNAMPIIENIDNVKKLNEEEQKEDGDEESDDYKRNLQIQRSKDLLQRAKKSLSDAFNGLLGTADFVFGPVSTRLANIDLKLRDAMRKFEYSTFMSQRDSLSKVKGFVESTSNMKFDDFNNLDFALKNRDIPTAQKILKKYGLEKEYNSVRDLLNEFPQKAENVGIKMGFIEDYWPRSVSDVKGLMSKIRGDENWNMFERAILEHENDIGYKLSEEDKARLITQMVSGYGVNKVSLGGGKFTKSRKINILSPEYNEYYKNINESLLDYVRSMNSLIEGRKFLGRESEEVSNIRKKIRDVRSRIVEITAKESADVKRSKLGQLFSILQSLNKDIQIIKDLSDIPIIQERIKSLENYISIVQVQKADVVKKSVLNKLNETLEELEGDILTKNTNIDKGIGEYVRKMVEENVISNDQAEELTEIIRSRMNNRSISNKGMVLLKDMIYFSTLNDVTNGITQLGDLVLSVYKNGLSNTVLGISDIVSGKEVVTRESIGIGDTIAAEFDSLRHRDKARDFIFKFAFISPFDKIGKSVFLQSSLRELRSKVNSGNKSVINEIDRVFGEDADRVISEIKNSELTYDVKYLLFCALSNVQPISLSEVPEGYLKAQNLKIAYALKTFAIKALDIARNDVYNEIRRGNVKEGVSNLFKLSVAFALMGATTGALKRFILGQDFDFEEDAIDGLMQLFMYNRYVGFEGQREGFIKAWLQTQIPPVYKIPDDLFNDFMSEKEIKDFKSVRDIPLVGEFYYWWFGGGVKKKEDKHKRGNQRKNSDSRI